MCSTVTYFSSGERADAIFRALGVGSILHSEELLLLGFIWGHELLHHTLGVVTLIPRYTLFSILPLKACKHWFVIHFNIWSIFIATFILSSILFIPPFHVLVTTIKDHVDINSSFLCKILLWAYVRSLPEKMKKIKVKGKQRMNASIEKKHFRRAYLRQVKTF